MNILQYIKAKRDLLIIGLILLFAIWVSWDSMALLIKPNDTLPEFIQEVDQLIFNLSK
jgi:hypothetical protein